MTTTKRKETGYVPCACRDCMEIAIGTSGEGALCHECESAGCEANDGECSVPWEPEEEYRPLES